MVHLYGNNFGPLCLILKMNSLMIMQNYAVQNGEVMISLFIFIFF
jgi:hypothetical protein